MGQVKQALVDVASRVVDRIADSNEPVSTFTMQNWIMTLSPGLVEHRQDDAFRFIQEEVLEQLTEDCLLSKLKTFAVCSWCATQGEKRPWTERHLNEAHLRIQCPRCTYKDFKDRVEKNGHCYFCEQAMARCCPKAKKSEMFCVCTIMTSCPDHGSRCHGTHD